MPSPFPGMDPYLEPFWLDIHASMNIYIRDDLASQLPPGLVARAEQRVYLEEPGEERRVVSPDDSIHLNTTWDGRSGWSVHDEGGVAVAETSDVAVLYKVPPRKIRETLIEVLDASKREVVTTLELLSPSNKRPGPGRDAYLDKQGALLQSQTSLVEIDLLRGGRWTVTMPESAVKPAHRTTYRACVWRWWDPYRYALYPIGLRDPLPPIRVPLRRDEQSITLHLKPLLDRAYRNGGYDGIDYTQPPDPPLNDDDASWLADRLREQPAAA